MSSQYNPNFCCAHLYWHCDWPSNFSLDIYVYIFDCVMVKHDHNVMIEAKVMLHIFTILPSHFSCSKSTLINSVRKLSQEKQLKLKNDHENSTYFPNCVLFVH